MKTPEDVVHDLFTTYAHIDRMSDEKITAESLYFLAARAIEADRAQRADTIAELRDVMQRYVGWHVDCPEDSWRFERDLWAALGEEIPEEGDE